MGGKQEAGEEGEEEVVTVTGQGVAGVAAAAAAEEDLQTGKHVFLAFTTKSKSEVWDLFYHDLPCLT